jgi:hypothetical protein
MNPCAVSGGGYEEFPIVLEPSTALASSTATQPAATNATTMIWWTWWKTSIFVAFEPTLRVFPE